MAFEFVECLRLLLFTRFHIPHLHGAIDRTGSDELGFGREQAAIDR